MTEAEWRGCTDPTRMLTFLRGKTSERKLRLFACAAARCCNYFELDHPGDAEAIRVAERWADGDRAPGGLAEASERAVRAGAKWVVEANAMTGALHWASAAHAKANYLVVQCNCLRDIFGSPFRAMTVEPALLAWGDGITRRLAEAIYEERAFDRLPILADALEEAGCTEQGILDHLRDPGPHARGCFALDLVLARK
jgi:hypothetical protein